MCLYGVMIWVNRNTEERFIYELDIYCTSFGNESIILHTKLNLDWSDSC